jgi:hypothetical protein
MLRKFLFIAFLALLAGWSSFALYSIVDASDEKSYLALFNPSSDPLIVAIHHPEDFNLENLEVDCNQKNLTIYASLIPKIADLTTVYLSKNRNLMVFKTREKWSIKRIQNTFERGIYSFELTGPNTFKFGKFLGRFRGKEILLYSYELALEDEREFAPWLVDPQSSYSIIYLTDPKRTIRDVYYKSDLKISYTSSDIKSKKPRLVNDLSLFGNLIPKKTKTYQFFERNYLIETDHTFKISPIKKLIKTGLVILSVEEQPVLVFDMNQDIGLSTYLNDFYRLEETNQERGRFKSFPVCSAFNNLLTGGTEVIKAKQLIAYSIDGFGFLTPDEGALDAVLLELEMQKSITTTSDESSMFDVPLPKQVSYRSLGKNNQRSISWIGNRLIETTWGKIADKSSTKQLEETKNYFTMNPGSSVLSFCALSGRGNVVMEIEQALVGYKNGSLKWRKPLATSLSDRPFALNSTNVENEFILLPFENHIDVIDKMGRPQYTINGTFSGPPMQCIINKQPAFGIQGKDGIYFFASSTGKALKRFIVNEAIDSWTITTNTGKQTLLIKTDEQMLSMDYSTGKRQVLRTNPSDFITFTSSGYLQRGAKSMQEVIGSKFRDIQVPSYWKYSGEMILSAEKGQLFHDGKTMAFVIDGNVRWKKTIAHSEISELVLSLQTPSLFVLRDALENKLYLWNWQGSLLDQEERPCQRSIQVSPMGVHGASITTYLNDFIIQYNF